MQIGRRPVHANRPNERTDPYVSWHCRKTVTGASQAAGHSSARSEISSKGRRLPPLRTGFVCSVSDGKVHGRDVHEHSALAISRAGSAAVTRQDNQRAEISMNDARSFAVGGTRRSATSARVAARLAAALRGAPCVVSGREERGRGNPARVRSARPPGPAAGGGGGLIT